MKRRVSVRSEERKRGADHERQSLATGWLASSAKGLLTLNRQAEKFLGAPVANNICNFWQAVYFGGLNWVQIRVGTIHLHRRLVSNMEAAASRARTIQRVRLSTRVRELLQSGANVIYHWPEEEDA